jgi:hypothetical protein
MTLSGVRIAMTNLPAWACVCVVLAIGSTRAFQGPQTPPPSSAAPAAKDAFVERQLARLFAGAPVRVTVRRDAIREPFQSDSTGESALVVVSKAGAAAAAEPDYALGLFDYGDVAMARRSLQEGLRSLTAPVAATKAGYDEFYVAAEGRMMGRVASLVLHVYSSAPGASDSALTVLARNVAANPTLLSELVKYASTMHFGDVAPMKAALVNLKARVPELLAVTVNDSGVATGPARMKSRRTMRWPVAAASGSSARPMTPTRRRRLRWSTTWGWCRLVPT